MIIPFICTLHIFGSSLVLLQLLGKKTIYAISIVLKHQETFSVSAF